MKKIVKLRNIVIGEGMPKICVPIVGASREEILDEARAVIELPADIVEWRIDHYEDVFDRGRFAETLGELRAVLGDMPLLVTFRSSAEGGEKAADDDEYAKLVTGAAESGFADMVDVEMFRSDDIAEKVIGRAHKAGVAVIGSYHDFEGTPAKDEIVWRLRRIQELGADISKIAVMPQSRKDVLTLLTAAEEMASKYADGPIAAISMGSEGLISRIAGESFGSAITFGAGAGRSAPGQIGAEKLKGLLSDIHEAMQSGD